MSRIFSPEQALRIEEVCTRYEKDRRAGRPMCIESYLSAVAGEDHEHVLQELVALEIELRQREGHQLTPREYHERFPELDLNWLTEVVSAGIASPSTACSRKSPAAPVILVSRLTGKEIPLISSPTVIGRAPKCDIVLRASKVSQRHCRIVWDPSDAVVEDLNSANGTRVNGRLIQKLPLHDGDELNIAGHVFRIKMRQLGQSTSARTSPV
jgi:hypothetical protein